MLGSWAPGNKAAPGELARKVVDAVVSQGWDQLDGDLVIADQANPAFVTASRSLAPHQEVDGGEVLRQVVRGRHRHAAPAAGAAGGHRDPPRPAGGPRADDDLRDGPAYVEDEEYEVDELGDLDDLDVQEYGDEPAIRRDDDPVGYEDADEADEDYDAYEEWDEDVDDEAYEDGRRRGVRGWRRRRAADEGLDEDESDDRRRVRPSPTTSPRRT